MNYMLIPECFVLRMPDKFLPQCVSRFEVNPDMMVTEDPPECLRYFPDIRNDDVVTFSHLLLSVCSGSFEVLTKLQFG